MRIRLSLLSVTVLAAVAACSTPEPGSVSSQGQSGGVTANTVETVNQTVAPKIKSPYLAKLQSFYADGARILRSAQATDVTDAQINLNTAAAENWANLVYQWLNQNVTPAAAERFVKRGGLSYTWTLTGTHADGEQARRDSTINAMSNWLDNLDSLMRSDEMYPQ